MSCSAFFLCMNATRVARCCNVVSRSPRFDSAFSERMPKDSSTEVCICHVNLSGFKVRKSVIWAFQARKPQKSKRSSRHVSRSKKKSRNSPKEVEKIEVDSDLISTFLKFNHLRRFFDLEAEGHWELFLDLYGFGHIGGPYFCQMFQFCSKDGHQVNIAPQNAQKIAGCPNSPNQ